jgi:hypothetical protein
VDIVKQGYLECLFISAHPCGKAWEDFHVCQAKKGVGKVK